MTTRITIPPLTDEERAAAAARQAEWAGRQRLSYEEKLQCANFCLAEGDVEGWAIWQDSHNLMAEVWDQRAELKTRGLYERALLVGFTGMYASMVLYPMRVLAKLFALANPKALRLAGDPLPPDEWFTVYRGICGRHPYRRIKGYSWSLDEDTAQKFAELPGGPDPAVYAAEIEARRVYAYLNEGYREGEQEMIVRPRYLRNIRHVCLSERSAARVAAHAHGRTMPQRSQVHTLPQQPVPKQAAGKRRAVTPLTVARRIPRVPENPATDWRFHVHTPMSVGR